MRDKLLSNVKRVVIKIGTSVISEDNKLSRAVSRNLTKQISTLLKEKKEVVVVSSGAICAGMQVLNIKKRPSELPVLQAAASAGQNMLMRMWEQNFKREGFKVAQVLLTKEDLVDRRRYLNARNTLNALLRYLVVPIVNENDTVSADEIKFGDNDYLSSLVANLIDADLLIVLSDVDGLYKRHAHEHKELIKEVNKITPYITSLACGTTKEVCMGGMSSKIEAAKIATNSGVPMIMANGNLKNVIKRILKAEDIGTFFLPNSRLVSKKRWIAYSSKVSGKIIVDLGARRALVNNAKSLLPSGISDCSGSFAIGDIVSIIDINGNDFARGLTNYSSKDIKKIKGLKSNLIKQTLGYKYFDEIVHRDNLVII